MARIRVDYETKSGLDITKVGRVRYLTDKDAAIICMAYKIDNEPTRLWTPTMPVPQEFIDIEGHVYYAFNIKFDALVTELLGTKYGMKAWPINQQIDVMALCGRFTFPQNLGKAGIALNLAIQKRKSGKKLMGLICSPPFSPPRYTMKQLKEFYRYCIDDVNSMDEMIDALPADQLSADERIIWENTSAINDRGLPIDHAAVVRINEVIQYYTNKLSKRLPLITDGAVNTPGQRDAILRWLKGFDVDLPNLQAKTVEEAILQLDGYDEGRSPQEQEDIEKVIKVLQIRKELGGAAIKKYVRLLDMTHNGRLYDTIRYCGALHTGRDSGMGFQLQNLPRLSVKEPDKEIQRFYDTTILQDPDPMKIAKALIRPMIRAKAGYAIRAADYSSIEYVMLMWFCGETEKLRSFAAGICPYKTFGVGLLGIPYEDITKEQRQDCKPGILGGGYCLGGKSLIGYADDMGVKIEGLAAANRVINLFRRDHKLVVNTWELLVTASVDAVKYEGESYPVHSVVFKAVRDRTGRLWLTTMLPSGRALFYCDPKIGKSYSRDVVTYMGVNTYTKKWDRHTLRASVIINNDIQGMARDVMMYGSVNLSHDGYHLIGRVHDELIAEEKIGSDKTLERMIKIMCLRPPWCMDAPIKADGFDSERYKK